MAKKRTEFECEGNLLRLYNHYKTLALNVYRWEGLPSEIESKHIEQFLFENGQAFFTIDPVLGYICLKCNQQNGMNVYGEPLGYAVTGYGYMKTFSADNGIRIRNNDLCTPTMLHIIHYARKMDEIEKTISQNLRQQKFPYIITTTKTNEFSAKALWNKIENGEDALFIDKKWDEEGELRLQAIPTLAPYLIDKLHIHKLELERELLTFLGLDCVVEKKERLIADEANANGEQILLNLDLGFKTRREACELINKKYGLNISVKKVINDLVIEDNLIQLSMEEEIDNDEYELDKKIEGVDY